MFKKSFVLPVIALWIVLLSGCATMGSRFAMTLESGIFEDCFEMNAGQILEYSFEAEKPVDFNIHYHEDSEMYYPVSADDVTSRQGTFIAEKKQYYCIMLTNHYNETIGFNYTHAVTD